MLLYNCISHLLSSCWWQGSKWADGAGLAGMWSGGGWSVQPGRAGLSQKPPVTLLNSVCHKDLFLLRAGAVFLQPFCLQKCGSAPVSASLRRSFAGHWKKGSKETWRLCYMFGTGFHHACPLAALRWQRLKACLPTQGIFLFFSSHRDNPCQMTPF